MNRLSKVIINFMNILVCFAPIFVNLPTRLVLGEFGRSLHNLLFPFLLFFIIIKKQKGNNEEIKKNGIFLFLVVSFIFLSIWLYLLNGGKLVIYSENVVTKSIKMFFYLFTNIILFLYIIEYFENKYFKWLNTIIWGNLLLLIILILEILKPELINLINFGEGNRPGIRLLTAEPSWTTVLVSFYFIVGFLYNFYVKKSKFVEVFLYISLITQLVFTESKMSLIIFVFNILVSLLLRINSSIRKKIMKIVLYLLMSLIAFLLITPLVNKLILMILSDITNYTSISTRFYTIIIAIFTGIKYPFSAGGTYLYYFTMLLAKYKYLVESLNLSTREIEGLLRSNSAEGFTVKSGILSVLQFYGLIPFIIFIKIFFRDTLRKLKQVNVRIEIYMLFFINLVLLPMFDDVLMRPNFFFLMALIFIGAKKLKVGDEYKI